MAVFYDTHAHLDYDDYKPDFTDVLARAQAAGITKIIAIATDLDSSRRASSRNSGRLSAGASCALLGCQPTAA